MPELPEAENIKLALSRVLPGRSINRVEIFSPALRSSLLPLAEADLAGKSFTGVRRRGRYLVADLDDGRGLLIHLGMSGVIRVDDGAVPRRKHEHVFIYLNDGNIFRFECTRRFSLLEVCENCSGTRWPEKLNKLGVEPLSNDFTADYLFRRSRTVSQPVKSFLMDNAVVVGIGNIYATETLYAAGVLPTRRTKTLLFEECRLIVEHSRRILEMAIRCGGSTISDFLNVNGEEGKFARELKAYGFAGKKCNVCGNVFETIKIGGRSSCFCPGCQK